MMKQRSEPAMGSQQYVQMINHSSDHKDRR